MKETGRPEEHGEKITMYAKKQVKRTNGKEKLNIFRIVLAEKINFQK